MPDTSTPNRASRHHFCSIVAYTRTDGILKARYDGEEHTVVTHIWSHIRSQQQHATTEKRKQEIHDRRRGRYFLIPGDVPTHTRTPAGTRRLQGCTRTRTPACTSSPRMAAAPLAAGDRGPFAPTGDAGSEEGGQDEDSRPRHDGQLRWLSLACARLRARVFFA